MALYQVNGADNNLTVPGQIYEQSVQNSVVASTTHTQAGGTPITKGIARVTSATSNDAVTLPTSVVGASIVLVNVSGQTITVYPNAGGTGTEQINALGANAAYSLSTAKSVIFFCGLLGQWDTNLTA